MIFAHTSMNNTRRTIQNLVIVALLFGFVFLVPAAYGATVDPIIVSKQSIDFGTIFPGETVGVQFSVSLDPAHTAVTPYHIEAPAGGFNLCSNIVKSQEQGEFDTMQSALLTPTLDTVDNWIVMVQVPAKQGQAARVHTQGTVNGLGNFTCDFNVAFTEPDGSTPGEGDGGTGGDSDGDNGGNDGGGDTDTGTDGTGAGGQGGGSGAYALSLMFPPDIMENFLGLVTDTTAQVKWQTSRIATSWVVYDRNSHSSITNPQLYGYTFGTPERKTPNSHHDVTMTGLKPDTTYYYRMVAKDNKLIKVSREYSFHTKKAVAASGAGAGTGVPAAQAQDKGINGGNGKGVTGTGTGIGAAGTGTSTITTDGDGTTGTTTATSTGAVDDGKKSRSLFNFFVLLVLLLLILASLLFEEEKDGRRKIRWPWLLFWKRGHKSNGNGKNNGGKNGKH